MSNSRLALSPVLVGSAGVPEASAGHRVRRGLGLAAARRLGLLSWVAPLSLLLAWEVLARFELIPSMVLPAPSSVVVTAKALLVSGELQTHLAASLRRAALGFSVGSGLGL